MSDTTLIDTLLGPDSEGVRLIAVSTLHGSATIDGTSDPMGNEADGELFAALREWADVAVVGSGTVKAEGYEVATSTRLAVLSQSLDFAGFEEFVAGGPIILTPEERMTSAEAQQLEAAGAELVSTGTGSVTEAIAALRERGATRISCEGGPSIYSAFIESGLLDKLYLTIDPHISPSVEKPVVDGTATSPALRLELENATPVDSTVFLRYRRISTP
ncbi:dihydrofolate reductase family protein [Corynebacterium singulare]|uniref:Dihydrofolate reductase family protein n=1 Tax=Corynebacterium singulare TaxID=161899 RepID=A0A0B6EWC5_9CORY|nr:dihydrofolate reductase family protein [Corynebacterium singulare]AJI79093.1 pyrimidine reductase, riboflavin biosynthesis [Corynebacterium singulare]MCG7275227.1 dihydrofolate reductase family protein [Corynebacterium singulare]